MIDIEAAKQTGRQVKEQAEETMSLVDALRVPDDISYRDAVVLIAEVKEQLVEMEARRDTITKPMREALASVAALFGPGISALKDAEKLLKQKVLASRDVLELRAQALIEEASKTGNHALVKEADEVKPPDLKGVSITTTWTGVVEDASKIPKQYLVPDIKKLEEVTKAQKGQVKIPGWKVSENRRMSVTTSLIERKIG